MLSYIYSQVEYSFRYNIENRNEKDKYITYLEDIQVIIKRIEEQGNPDIKNK